MSTKSQENIVLSFLQFLKAPKHNIEFVKRKTAIDVLNIFILIILGIAINTALINLNIYIFRLTGYSFDNYQDGANEFVWWFSAFLILIKAPILEELTFRLGLKYSIYNFSFAIVFLLIAFTYELQNIFLSPTSDIYFFLDMITNPFIDVDYLVLIIFVLIFGFILVKIFKKYLNQDKMRNFFNRRFAYIFYGFAILFTLNHLSNFGNLEQIWYVIPIIILPQLVGATLLGYIRMRYGIFSSILAHSLNNLLNNYILIF